MVRSSLRRTLKLIHDSYHSRMRHPKHNLYRLYQIGTTKSPKLPKMIWLTLYWEKSMLQVDLGTPSQTAIMLQFLSSSFTIRIVSLSLTRRLQTLTMSVRTNSSKYFYTSYREKLMLRSLLIRILSMSIGNTLFSSVMISTDFWVNGRLSQMKAAQLSRARISSRRWEYFLHYCSRF